MVKIILCTRTSIIHAGAVCLGNPNSGERVILRNVPRHVIQTAENSSSTPKKLAVSLLQALFSEDVIRHGNCSQPRGEGILLLDEEKVRGIRGNCVHFTILEIGL